MEANMKDDFSEYERMKENGISPQAAYLFSNAAGLESFAQIRMLRRVFRLSLDQAKEVTVTATDESVSLSEHQGKLFPALKAALESMDH